MHDASTRYAAVATVEAFEMLGFTRSAAAVVAARFAGVHCRTIWLWLKRVDGIAHQDSYARLVALASPTLRREMLDAR